MLVKCLSVANTKELHLLSELHFLSELNSPRFNWTGRILKSKPACKNALTKGVIEW